MSHPLLHLKLLFVLLFAAVSVAHAETTASPTPLSAKNTVLGIGGPVDYGLE